MQYFEQTPGRRREVDREYIMRILRSVRPWSTDREKASGLTIENLEQQGVLKVNKYRTYFAEREGEAECHSTTPS